MRITLASRENVQLLSTKGEVFQGPPDRAASIKYTSLKRRGFVPRGPPSSNGPSGSFCSRAKDVSIFAVTTAGALSSRRSPLSPEIHQQRERERDSRYEAVNPCGAFRHPSASSGPSRGGHPANSGAELISRALPRNRKRADRREIRREVVAPRSPVARSLTSGRKAENLLLWN